MHNLKKITIVTTLSLSLLLSAAAGAFAAAQLTCPVMGGKINKELYADYKGERVYFCCMACPPQFTKDPEKFINKLKEIGQEPEKIETNKQGLSHACSILSFCHCLSSPVSVLNLVWRGDRHGIRGRTRAYWRTEDASTLLRSLFDVVAAGSVGRSFFLRLMQLS